MKDYITIHINERTLNIISRTIIYSVILVGIIIVLIYGVQRIIELGDDDAYNKGAFDTMNQTITNFRENGVVTVCVNNDCESFYEYVNPCGDKPDYCEWMFEPMFTTGNFNTTGDFPIQSK